jgi:signal transduction histidine kinase
LQHALKLQKAVNSQLLNASEAARMLRELHQSQSEGNKSGAQTFQSTIDSDLGKVIKAFGASDSDDLKTILQALLQQKENLAFRLVSEQEELKHRLARELNDTIVADLQMLKKYLAGDEKMSTEQSMEIVDGIVLQVAEICNDFLPKQLHEKGLEQAVKDLIERVARRSGMYCDTLCPKPLMNLPQPVQLHVFRIIQDWVGVIEKFARASKVNVRFDQSDDGVLKIVVFDNGKGSTKAGQVDPRIKGMKGMQNLQERIELIRCYFETKVEIECHPGNSKLELEILSKAL